MSDEEVKKGKKLCFTASPQITSGKELKALSLVLNHSHTYTHTNTHTHTHYLPLSPFLPLSFPLSSL